jgi:RHS repeat-associated protein
MQAQTSIRVPDACTTPPHVCLLSEASGYRSISTGKERDAESGNDYFEARYYSSSMGRFMSPDWSAKEDPVPYANLDDPQSLNLYSYVRNNPLDRTDPDGHCTGVISCTLEIGAAVVLAPEEAAGIVLGAVVVGGLGAGAYDVAHGYSPSAAPGGYPTSMPIHLKSDAPAPTPEIVVDGNKHPESAQHVADAQAAGKPSEVTIDRAGAKDNRAEALKGTAAVPGQHRDEYPPATTKEGGSGASVRPISPGDNTGSGASMGNQMRPYPDGTKVKITPINVPKPPGS